VLGYGCRYSSIPGKGKKARGSQPGFCPNISGESFHRVKRPVQEFDHLHPSGDEVRKEWNCGMYRVALLPSLE
jgi:hypothetical protein